MQPGEIFRLVKGKFPQVTQEEATGAIVIPSDILLDAAVYLRSQELGLDNLHCITAIDRKERIELVYIFFSIEKHYAVTIKVYLNPDDLKVASLAKIWRSADWLEREVYDLFGVYFLNHPDLRRILTPYSWNVHPLRKDFSRPDFIKKPQY